MCDYTPVLSDNYTTQLSINSDLHYTTKVLPVFENIVICDHNYDISQRGPPSVS
ncbi:MAG: hypothetical protein JSS91_07125 [Bacteroidetes bacterium]|nr:hypothetical protein [Bacteroidota bacterium]